MGPAGATGYGKKRLCGVKPMGALDDYLLDPKISLLDKTRIQAQVLLPVMRALRTELGKDKADAIVRSALRDWSKQIFAAIGADIEGSKRRKWAAMQGALNDVTEREVTFEMHRQDKEALEFDVTSCRFAEFFRALGEPELGARLVCQTDFDIAAVAEGAVHLEREQTLMQGGSCCAFRYRFEPRQ
jgi:predicted ArsR family transcriptional regulator